MVGISNLIHVSTFFSCFAVNTCTQSSKGIKGHSRQRLHSYCTQLSRLVTDRRMGLHACSSSRCDKQPGCLWKETKSLRVLKFRVREKRVPLIGTNFILFCVYEALNYLAQLEYKPFSLTIEVELHTVVLN